MNNEVTEMTEVRINSNKVGHARKYAIDAVRKYARACAKYDAIPPIIRGEGSVMEDFVYKAFAYEVYLVTPSLQGERKGGKGGLRETGRRLNVDYAGLARNFKKIGLEL